MNKISDYFYHYISPNRQVYTSNEIGIPGIRLFGHFTESKANKPLEFHIHPGCMEICYVAKGNQLYKTNGTEYMLSGNTAFITFPDEVHGSGSDPFGKLELYWIQLDFSINNDFLSLSLEYSCLLLNSLMNIRNRLIKCKDNMKPLLDEAILMLTSEDKIKKAAGLSCLIRFLTKILEYDEQSINGISPRIQKSIEYIKDNINQKFTLMHLAEYAGLSLSHFKARFKKETGDTPNDYINFLKIEKAKQLLKKGDKTVTEIAFDLDFSSSAYFSVVFKRYTGTSPAQFLRNN